MLPPWTPIGITGSGGVGGGACDGRLVFDFGSWLASGADPRLIPGQAVHAQAWVRDPSDPTTVALSNGVAFVVEP